MNYLKKRCDKRRSFWRKISNITIFKKKLRLREKLLKSFVRN